MNAQINKCNRSCYSHSSPLLLIDKQPPVDIPFNSDGLEREGTLEARGSVQDLLHAIHPNPEHKVRELCARINW